MEATDCKTNLKSYNHLFSKDTAFVELFIQNELGSTGQYETLLATLNANLESLYDDWVDETDHGDYEILTTTARMAGNHAEVSMDVAVNGISEEVLREITFADYLQYTQLRIVSNLDNDDGEHHFDMNAHGLLEAVQKYKELALRMEKA